MTLAELEAGALKLSSAEQARLIQILLPSVTHTFAGIEKTPGVCGGDARIIRTRITVWFLEELRRTGLSESEVLRRYPHLTATDLANAWAYVAANRAEIDTQIQDNEAAMTEPL